MQVTGAKEAVGVDISEQALLQAASKGIKTLRCNLNFEKLNLSSDYFDMIISSEMIYYLHNTDNMFTEAARCLKESGIFILSSRNLASWTNRIALLLGHQPFYQDVSTRFSVAKLFQPSRTDLPYGGFVRSFTLRALTALLSIYGFTPFKVEGYQEAHMESKILRQIDKIFTRFPVISSGVVVGSAKRPLDETMDR
jgi:ubiquinone/menaquinone biosynthesis C-methylase UbiE